MFENKAHVNPVKLYVSICPNGVLLTSRNQQALSQSHTNAMNNCDSKDNYWSILKWDKAFKNGPSKICGRKPFKNLKWYGLPKFSWFILEYLDPYVSFDSQPISCECFYLCHYFTTFCCILQNTGHHWVNWEHCHKRG